jgi:hypothetical protein
MEFENTVKTVNMTKKNDTNEKLVRKATSKWRFENKNLDFMENLCVLQKYERTPEGPTSGQGGTPSVLQGGQLCLQGGTPSVLQGGTPSVLQGGTPSVLQGGTPSVLTEVHEEIRRQINYKINSYKGQDVKKGLLLETDFVNYEYVLNLLIEKQLKCFYCLEDVLLLYNYVRENKQWTLERIDNKIGHNRGNVEIACLQCNLRRRTMYHERYVFTKQLCVIKMDV